MNYAEIVVFKDGRQLERRKITNETALRLVDFLYENGALFQLNLRGKLVLDFDTAQRSLKPQVVLEA